MTTTTLALVPKILSVSERVRVQTDGLVHYEQRVTTRVVNETFGPLDWVNYLKRLPQPSQARRRRGPIALLLLAALGCVIGAGCVLLWALNSPGVPIGTPDPTRFAVVYFFGLLLAAMACVVTAVSISHPQGADAALAAVWGGFAAQDAHNGRWLGAGANAVFAGQALYRIHTAVKSREEAQEQDAAYWETLGRFGSLEQKWEAALWYHRTYQQQSGRSLPSYDEVVKSLQAHPQAW